MIVTPDGRSCPEFFVCILGGLKMALTHYKEFENYLKKQQIKTTFNGSELESFSWYKKALGLV